MRETAKSRFMNSFINRAGGAAGFWPGASQQELTLVVGASSQEPAARVSSPMTPRETGR